ncbi:hypothetical protein GW17_00059516 [Ensete ventricosum]|nr:hypothetical protein GW17_00059516 [Ensete ventricosum]
MCLFRPDRVKALVNLSIALVPFIPRNPAGKLVDYFRSLYGDDYYICRNWELGAPWCGVKIQVPTKFIVGDLDLAYHYPGIQDYLHRGGFKQDVPMLEEVVVMEGVAHFINQEKSHEITDHIYHFIRKF